jgi:hypothetical protein
MDTHKLTDEQIDEIVEGQTECTYEKNGPWIVEQQMKYAIKQALKLTNGEEITLPNRKKMRPAKYNVIVEEINDPYRDPMVSPMTRLKKVK